MKTDYKQQTEPENFNQNAVKCITKSPDDESNLLYLTSNDRALPLFFQLSHRVLVDANKPDLTLQLRDLSERNLFFNFHLIEKIPSHKSTNRWQLLKMNELNHPLAVVVISCFIFTYKLYFLKGFL